MAKKKKKKKKKKSESQGKSKATNSARQEEVSPQDIPERSRGSHWWATYRGPLVGALAAVVLAGLWGPTRAWIDGATDSVHDVFVSFTDFDRGRVDDMQERIRDRPFWEDDPSFKSGSLDFMANHLSGDSVSTLRTGTTSAEILTVDEVVEEAPNLDGDPVIVIGRFVSNTLLGGDILTLDREETVLRGNKFFIYVANGNGYERIYGDGFKGLAAAQGVLLATGRAKASNDPDGVETGYFGALEAVSVSPRNPDFRRSIKVLTQAQE